MNIIKIKKKHYNNLANFLSKYFVPKKNVEFYKKKFNYYWDNNPSYNDKVVRGFILMEKNEIKGSILNIPIEYLTNKNINFKISCPCYWYVLENYRSYSLNILLEYIKTNNNIINSTPNKQTIPIYKRLDFEDLNENNNSYIKLNSYKLIHLFFKKFIPIYLSNFISKILFKIYYLFFIFFSNFSRKKIIEFEEIKKISLIKKHILTVKIFYKNIDWYFQNKNKKFFIYYTNKNEVKYIITSESRSSNNIKFLEILDSNIDDIEVFNSFENYYLKKINQNKNYFDYIWIHSIKKKFIVKNFYFNSSKFKKRFCLVNANILNKISVEHTSILGEYGLIND